MIHRPRYYMGVVYQQQKTCVVLCVYIYLRVQQFYPKMFLRNVLTDIFN